MISIYLVSVQRMVGPPKGTNVQSKTKSDGDLSREASQHFMTQTNSVSPQLKTNTRTIVKTLSFTTKSIEIDVLEMPTDLAPLMSPCTKDEEVSPKRLTVIVDAGVQTSPVSTVETTNIETQTDNQITAEASNEDQSHANQCNTAVAAPTPAVVVETEEAEVQTEETMVDRAVAPTKQECEAATNAAKRRPISVDAAAASVRLLQGPFTAHRNTSFLPTCFQKRSREHGDCNEAIENGAIVSAVTSATASSNSTTWLSVLNNSCFEAQDD